MQLGSPGWQCCSCHIACTPAPELLLTSVRGHHAVLHHAVCSAAGNGGGLLAALPQLRNHARLLLHKSFSSSDGDRWDSPVKSVAAGLVVRVARLNTAVLAAQRFKLTALHRWAHENGCSYDLIEGRGLDPIAGRRVVNGDGDDGDDDRAWR